MRQPIEFRTALLIFVAVLVIAAGAIWYSIERQKEITLSPISSDLLPSSNSQAILQTIRFEYDNYNNRKLAQQAGLTPEQYGYKIFLDNPPKDSTTTMQGNVISLFAYPFDWNDLSDRDLAALSNGQIIWHDRSFGLHGYKFIDINSDGTPEIEADSDGGGNRPGCLNAYYRWTSKTFETIKFMDSFTEAGQDTGSCYSKSEWSSSGAGLHITSNTTTYISYIWRYSYPELHDAATGSVQNWPIKARLCKEIEVTYQYDKNKGQFTEVSQNTVDEEDVYQNGIAYFCY